ncbi:MAG: carboxymuconolactone decarboxylase [Armatimonadetes bacterium]|nr:carboxymuconolactone decarboxylase [Armatimonadota bacterium]
MAELPDVRESLEADERLVYERMLARRREHGTGLYGPYVPLLNHPRLAERVEALGGFLKFEGVLPRTLYQFAVLAFARETGVKFEWADHAEPARQAGLPEAVIQALEAGSGELPDPYQTVQGVIRAVIAYRSIPAGLQERAIELVGVAGIVELVVLCGLYALMGYVSCSFDVPLPPRGGS